MREVRKLTKSGHQTSLISTACGLDHTILAARMFTRWCQEIFFGYVMKHYAIDTLSEYAVEDLSNTARVVNPLWRELNRQRNYVQSKLRCRQARFAEMTLHPASEDEAEKISKWKKKKSELLEEIQAFEQGTMNPARLQNAMTGWLGEHSLSADMEYADFIRDIRERQK
jgi:hypothetical protein